MLRCAISAPPAQKNEFRAATIWTVLKKLIYVIDRIFYPKCDDLVSWEVHCTVRPYASYQN